MHPKDKVDPSLKKDVVYQDVYVVMHQAELQIFLYQGDLQVSL